MRRSSCRMAFANIIRVGYASSAITQPCSPLAPITYGFSIAYITLCVGVGTPSWRPSSATLPPSHGSFEPVAALEVERHRRLHGRRRVVLNSRIRSSASDGSVDAPGAADIDHFLVGGDENRTHVRVVAQLADRLPGQRHDAGVGGEQDELHPELGEDLLAQGRRRNPAFRHSARKSSARRLRLPSSSPKIMRMKVPTWRDHARAGDRGRDLRHAAHHRVGPKDRDQPLGGVDAVLQRDHRGVRGRSAA